MYFNIKLSDMKLAFDCRLFTEFAKVCQKSFYHLFLTNLFDILFSGSRFYKNI